MGYRLASTVLIDSVEDEARERLLHIDSPEGLRDARAALAEPGEGRDGDNLAPYFLHAASLLPSTPHLEAAHLVPANVFGLTTDEDSHHSERS